MEVVRDIVLPLQPALSATSDQPLPPPPGEAAPVEEKPAEVTEVTTDTVADTGEAKEEAKPEPVDDDGVPKNLDKTEPWVKAWISKNKAAAKEAKREAEEAKAMLREVLAKVPNQNAPERPQLTGEPEPKQEDFSDPDSYQAARFQWAVRAEVSRTLEAKQREDAERTAQQKQEAQRKDYAERIEKARQAHADFSEYAESPDLFISMPMAQAIMTSEQGPEIQYYLGKHPDEAKAIAQLEPIAAVRAIGKIEAKLVNPSAVETKQVSRAPAPIKPLAGNNNAGPKDPEQETADEYIARRRAEIRAAQ